MKLRPNFNSLATRLVLLGLFLLLIGALGRIFLLSDFLRQDLTAVSSAQLLSIANYVAKDIDRVVVERRAMLAHLAKKFPLQLLNDPAAMRSWLGERHEVNPVFSLGLAVLDLSGKALADYPVVADPIGASYADRDYFRHAMDGEFAIGRPVVGRTTQTPTLPMALPLKDGDGKVRAVLVGVSDLRSPNFLNALYTTPVGASGGLVLVSPRDKLFLGASDAQIALTPTPQEGRHPQHDKAMAGFRGVGIDVRGEIEELAAIASVPSSGWFVVARIPTAEIFAPIDRLRQFILRNSAYLLAFMCLFMTLILRRLLRPLTDAALHADRMTRGEIPFEPLPVAHDDEVGHLTTAFNRLLAKLLESRAALQHIAHHDVLTGLPNRQLLADRMQQALARAERRQGRVAVLFLDLDGFKPINDELGHEAGDAALREVAARLLGAVRREDTVARVGGDEFVIVLSDLQENAKEIVERVANACLNAFVPPFAIRARQCKLGTSIGMAMGVASCEADKLLIAADEAMYRAKESGRGKFVWSKECSACSACASAELPTVCGIRAAHAKTA